jgi:phospholipase/lecithinase/hemolysin
MSQAMIMLGGRRFIFVGLPPMGCLPIARTLVGTGSDRCDETLNQLATSFNSKLIQLLNFINFQHQIRTSYIDTYTTIHSATVNPNAFGMQQFSFSYVPQAQEVYSFMVWLIDCLCFGNGRPNRSVKRVLRIGGD